MPEPVSTWLNKLPKMAATRICVPRVTPVASMSLWETLQDQQVGLTQAPFTLLLLPQDSEHVRFCVHPLRVESISPSPVALLKVSSAGFQSQILWGLVFLVLDPWARGPDLGLRSHSCGRTSAACLFSNLSIVSSRTRDWIN